MHANLRFVDDSEHEPTPPPRPVPPAAGVDPAAQPLLDGIDVGPGAVLGVTVAPVISG